MPFGPCGECHLEHGETCDICGAKEGRAVPSVFTKRPISHDEAYEALKRFENHFWKKDDARPRISIPAKPDYDDDLVLHAYIRQQRNKEAAQSAE